MRKLMAAVCLAVFVAVSVTWVNPSIAHANDISVEIDGTMVVFGDVTPVTVDGRILVPIREVFEAIGFNIIWHDIAQTAVLSDGTNEISITIGRTVFVTNGQSFFLDVPAQLINGRTMIPLRAPLESVGHTLGWNAATQTVLVTTAPVVIADNLNDENYTDYIDGLTTSMLIPEQDSEEENEQENEFLYDGVASEEELRVLIAEAAGQTVTVYLATDITLDGDRGSLVIPSGTHVTLKSSGRGTHTLYAGGDFDVITVQRDASLTIDGINITRLSGTTGSGVNNNGLLVFLDGAVSGHIADIGAGVNNDGKFIMYGGIIFGNAAISHRAGIAGGGVFNSGQFIMNGGEIAVNAVGGPDVLSFDFAWGYGWFLDRSRDFGDDWTAPYFEFIFGTQTSSAASGGGIGNTGQFNMNGGVVFGNLSIGGMGGGGGVNNRGEFVMTGGEIIGNIAAGFGGGGIENDTNGVFTMYGGSITGNLALYSGAGGGLLTRSGQFIFINGEITGNARARKRVEIEVIGGVVGTWVEGPFESNVEE